MRKKLTHPFSFNDKLITAFLSTYIVGIWGLAYFAITALQEQSIHVLLEKQFISTQHTATALNSQFKDLTARLEIIARNSSGTISQRQLNNSLASLRPLQSPFHDGISLIGLDGRVIASFPDSSDTEKADFGKENFFIRVTSTHKNVIETPATDQPVDQRMINIAAPVFNSDNILSAVIVGRIRATDITIFSREKKSSSTDQKMRLITSPLNNLVIVSSDPKNSMRAFVQHDAIGDFTYYSQGNEGSLVLHKKNGDDLFVSGKFEPISGWLVTQSTPKNLAVTPFENIALYIYVMAVLTTLIAAFFIWFNLRKIFREPTDEKRKNVAEQEIASFDITSESEHHAEVNALISNVNLMIEKRLKYKINTENIQKKHLADTLSLVENSPDMIARFDLDSRFIYVNTQFEESYEISRIHLLGKKYDEMALPNNSAEKWMASIEKVLDTESEDIFEYSFTNFNSTFQGKKYYRTSLVPEFDEDRHLVSVLAVAHDISTIRQSEAALRENENRLSGIIQNTPGMVFQCVTSVADKHLNFTYISEGSLLLFELMPAEIMENSYRIEQKFLPENQQTFIASMHQAINSMSTWNWDGRAIQSDGSEKWINCRATPRHAHHGEIIWEGVMLDITASKQTEQQLINSKQELRNLAAHREIGREGDRKKIAREIHDELGQALTVLRMNLSLISINFGAENATLNEHLQSMKIDLDKTIKIMRHVTSTLRPVALDLGLTAGLEWLVQEVIKNTGIKCHLHSGLHDNEALDDARATALFRIVQESLTNIVKHAKASEVTISIDIKHEEHGNFVRLKIKDNGEGFILNMEAKKNSFGLIGIQERAVILQGQAKIYSAPGQGTLIDVSIPLVALMQS